MRVGIAQIDVALGEREENFCRVRSWAAEHCPGERGSVIVLPELWDVGYVIEEGAKYADFRAEWACAFLGGLAREYGVWFAGGSVLCSCGAGVTNRALVINPDGLCTATYDKAHLVPMMDEEKYLAPGSERCIFSLCGHTAGCVICYDVRFCEWLRCYALGGAQVIFVSAQWPTSRIEHWRALLVARAIENICYVAACNRVGTSGDTPFGGHSMIISPLGEVLYEGGPTEEAVFTDIDVSSVQKARDYLQVYRMRRPELYTDLLSRG